MMYIHIDGLVQDSSISIALAMEILQSSTESLMFSYIHLKNENIIYITSSLTAE